MHTSRYIKSSTAVLYIVDVLKCHLSPGQLGQERLLLQSPCQITLLPVECLYARNTNGQQHRLHLSSFMYNRGFCQQNVYMWWLDYRPGWSKDATSTAFKKLGKDCLTCQRSWRDHEPNCYWPPPTQCTSPHVCSLDPAFIKASSLPIFLQQLPKH